MFSLKYGSQTAYNNLATKEADALYFIPDSGRIYRGDHLIAANNIKFVDTLPTVANAFVGVLYVTSSDSGISLSVLNEAGTEFVTVASSSTSVVTPDGAETLTNKTIDASQNTITNLEVSNFGSEVISTVISETPSDTKLVTEKAVADAIGELGDPIVSVSTSNYDETADPSKKGKFKLSFTTASNQELSVDLDKEKFLQSAQLSEDGGTLVLTLTDNSTVEIDLAAITANAKTVKTIDNEIAVELGAGGALGGYKTGDKIAVGTSIQTVIAKLLAKQVPPTYNQPSVTIANNGGTAAGSYEIGTSVTPKLKATFNKADAGNLISIAIGDFSSEQSPMLYDSPAFTLTTSTAYNATATYAEGAIKNDNLGEPYPTGHIAAGSKTSSNYVFTPYRQGYFYGVLATSSADQPLTSTIIRGGSKKNGAYTSGNLPLISASSVANRKRIFIACPATNVGVKKVIMPSAMNADCTSDFVKQSTTVTVEGANGYEGISYNVWIYEPASISDDQTFTVTLG